MKSTLKILTQLSKNIKSKTYEKPTPTIPKHMRKFPNMKFGKTSIIHYEKRVRNNVNFEEIKKFPTTLPTYKYRINPNIEEVRPPMNDFINFRNMPGNEILLNMQNAQFFRNGELCNSLYELSRRIELPENRSMKKYEWENHEYVKKALNETMKKLNSFNLRNIIVTTVALDKLNIKKPSNWLKIESMCDRLLHKLTCRQIITLLKILNNNMRGTREFTHKLITILPIHTPSLRSKEIIDILEICHDNNLQAVRLINYFLIPKIEKSVFQYTFDNYILLLKVLAKMRYQEDPIFWSDYILPCIFNYELTYKNAKTLWETYLNVKINCPSLDLSKYFILIENVLNKFEVLIEKNNDISNIKLSIDKDYSLIPKKEEGGISNMKIKKLQQRISEKEGKENVLRDLGINVEKGNQEVVSFEGSLNKILEIKDWKKAKYDFNVLEMKKLKTQETEADAVKGEKKEEVNENKQEKSEKEKSEDIQQVNKEENNK